MFDDDELLAGKRGKRKDLIKFDKKQITDLL